MQGDVYVLEENAAGGGLRVLTLLLAFTSSIIATTMHTPTVRADEGDTLYCINATDVKIRPYAGTGTVSDIARLVGTIPDYYSEGYKTDLIGAKIDGTWTPINPSTCKPFSIKNINKTATYQPTTKDESNRNAHSGIGSGYNGAMVDSDGRLWFNLKNGADATSDLHASETYRFSHVAGYVDANTNDDRLIWNNGLSFSDGKETGLTYQQNESITITEIEPHYSGTVLLGHRVNDTNQPSSVVQMPTTGAPEGLSTVGLIAVGIGMAGITLMLSRRRS